MTTNTTRPTLKLKQQPLRSLADLGAALKAKVPAEAPKAPKVKPAPPPPPPPPAPPAAPAVAASASLPTKPRPPEFKVKIWLSPTADSRTLSILEPLVKLLPVWPPVLPNKVGDVIKPLKIGALHDLTAMVPSGDEVATDDVRRVLYRYRRSGKYTYAVAADDSIRHDLDGQPVEPVAEVDRRGARISLQRHITKARDRRDQARAEQSAEAVFEKETTDQS